MGMVMLKALTENAVPIKPANKANIKYNVPIFLAFDEINRLSLYIDIFMFFIFKNWIIYIMLSVVVY